MTIRAWRSHGARSNNPGTPFDRESPRKGRPWGPRAPLHHRCVGCGTQGRPGRSGRPNLRYERWGNRRRGTRRRGAATAIEWRTVRPEPQAVVRSTLPEARALLPGAVRSEVRARSAGVSARVQRAVRGEAGTRRRTGCTGASRGDARSRRSRPGRARRGLRRVLRKAPARGERGGGSNDAVEHRAGGGGPARGGERSEPPGKRSAQ